MAKKYIIFRSEGSPVRGDQCTTRWPEGVDCKIVLSGEVENYFYNIMVMDGDIDAWLAENEGKVAEATKEQANALGQQIVPPGTERVEEARMEGEEAKTYVAGTFDVDNPEGLWTLKQ